MANHYDLVIIGGGPAGCAAAITAAANGIRVLLLEKDHFPRHKVCGEFISAESLVLLQSLLGESGKSLTQDSAEISEARIFADDDVIKFPIEPAAVSIRRFDLDFGLWMSAQARGVDAREAKVLHVSAAPPYLVTTADEELWAAAVIDASGRWSNLNLSSELPEKSSRRTPNPLKPKRQEERWLGIKTYFREADTPPSTDLYFFKGGYCGVQPSDGQSVNVCAVIGAEKSPKIYDILEKHPRLKLRSRGWRAMMKPLSTYPLFFSDPIVEQNGILKVGDAAGFIDPFTGDGISLALHSGAMAAQALQPYLAGGASLAQCVKDYRSEYEQRILPVFRTSSRLRRLMGMKSFIRSPLLKLIYLRSVSSLVMNESRIRKPRRK